MANWLKYMITLASAFLLMLTFRTLVLSVHSVTGNGLAPLFSNGDQLLINRCSYGLRIEGNGLLPYSRLLRQPVNKGDIVAFQIPGDSLPGLFIARCAATPGDTICTADNTIVVPGLKTCAQKDYYWLESVNRQNPADSRHLGLIPESHIIGQVITILYNRNNIRLQ